MTTRNSGLQLKAEASRLGFDQVGIAPAVARAGISRLPPVARGRASRRRHGLHEPARSRAGEHPRSVLEGVCSVVVVSVVYGRNEAGHRGALASDHGEGGSLRTRESITTACSGTSSRHCWRGCAPRSRRYEAGPWSIRAPLLERDFARLAGLGWIGKNTMLISRRLGSFTFLGALLVDAELAYDAPHEAEPLRHLHALPRRLSRPRHSPARTSSTPGAASATGRSSTEACSPITRRPQLDGWVFGCDICQDVCPWNRKAPPGREPSSSPAGMDRSRPDRMVDDGRRANGRPGSRELLWRGAKRGGLLRNAALVLGTPPVAEAIAPLSARLDDRAEEAVVRAAAAWRWAGSAPAGCPRGPPASPRRSRSRRA